MIFRLPSRYLNFSFFNLLIPYNPMRRHYWLLLCLTYPATVPAVDKVALSIKNLTTQGWKMAGLQAVVSNITAARPQIKLHIASLTLPKPFHDLTLLQVECTDFSWGNDELHCRQGKARLRSPRWQSPSTRFAFHIKPDDSSFQLTDLQLAGGKIELLATEKAEAWQITAQGRQIQASALQKLLSPKAADLKTGHLEAQMTAVGRRKQMTSVAVTINGSGFTGQTKDGALAAEKAGFKASLTAKPAAANWQWLSRLELRNGAVYLEPVYLEATTPLTVDAQGWWQPKPEHLQITSMRYKHGHALTIEGRAELSLKKAPYLEQAQISATSPDLTPVSATYLQPFLTQTTFEGIGISGAGRADLTVKNQKLTALNTVLNQVKIHDPKGRIGLDGGSAIVNWTRQTTDNPPSTFSWQQLKLGKVPVGATQLSFVTKASSARLLNKAVLPLLGGRFSINQLSWQGHSGKEPEVVFAGDLHQLSLEQLTQALGWTPMSGTITGTIPTVEYANKTLRLGGELLVKVFDGEIKVSNLAASGLFTPLPKFYSDLEINHLDMQQLTGKFEFGNITGKLSGYVRQIYLENWQPVSFYAWLGTPDDDRSRHRISQKAVNNIASIGGGGATDLVSRGVLGLFETFGYEKIGLGCYLHDGVCQLMGLEATPTGYLIIKGGGLPRIDVIGYNPRVDWNVLLDRLKRISSSDEVIVK